MHRFMLFFVSVLIVSYSMYVVVTAAEERVARNEEDISSEEGIGISTDEIVSANEVVSENMEIEDSNEDNVVLEEGQIDLTEETVSINAPIDSADKENVNEAVDTVSSNNSISDNEIEETRIESNSLSENEIDEISLEKDAITKVKLPTSTYICLDPENLLGKGEVFSEDYEVSNCGNRDILIKIKNVSLFQKGRADLYRLSESAVNDVYTDKVKVNLNMVWNNKKGNLEKTLKVMEGNIDEYVIYLKKAEYSEDDEFVQINDGGKGVFYFTGTLDGNLYNQWENSGATINFEYEIVDDEDEIDKFLEEISYRDDENNINEKEEISQ